MSYTIALATEADLPGLMRLERAAFALGERDAPSSYHEHMHNHWARLFLLKIDDMICGSLAIEAWPEDWLSLSNTYRLGDRAPSLGGPNIYVESICVHPDYARQGWASVLLRAGLHTQFDTQLHPIRKVIAAIRDDNTASRALAKSQGWAWVFERNGFFPKSPGKTVRFYVGKIAPSKKTLRDQFSQYVADSFPRLSTKRS